MQGIILPLLTATIHQQNVFLSLGVSGSVRELSDQNPRVVKCHSLLERCSDLQVHLGAPGSAKNKPGSTWERQQQALEYSQQILEHLKSQSSSLGKRLSSLGMLLVRLENIAATHLSTIVKSDVLSLYSDRCIYVSI